MKTTRWMPLMLLSLLLSGCASEIDKCVDAQMRAWSEKQLRLRAGEKIPSAFGGGFEKLDKRTPTEMEAAVRFACLRSAGQGNTN
jgi:hypothetical protein